MRRWSVGLLLLPAVLTLLVVYVLPVGRLLLSSVGAPAWTTAYFHETLTDPALWIVLRQTLVMALEVTFFCILLGYAIAYSMLHASPRRQMLIMALIVLPMWTSVLVRAYAWMVLLGRNGLINDLLLRLGILDHPAQFLYTRFAVVVGLVHVMLPYFVLPVFGVMTRIDLRLMAAARSLGAGRFSAFLFVFLPLSLPGVASGSLLVFILSIGFFVTPALLGGLQETTYVMLIERQVNQLMSWETAAAMSVILLVVTTILTLIWSRLLGFGALRGEVAIGDVAGLGRISTRLAALYGRIALRLRRWSGMGGTGRSIARRERHLFAGTVTWLTIFFIVAPLVVLLPLSFSGSPYLQFPPPTYSLRWYANYFSRYDWTTPTLISFEVGLITMVVATVLGTAAAIAVSRGRFPGRGFCLGLLTAPAITPTLLIGVGLYFQFAGWGLIGSVAGLVLAHLVLALPLVVLVVLGALRRVDEAPERAARSLGAHPVKAFIKVTLPMIRPSIFSAALFAFLASFDDVVMALFLSGTSAATLPKRMWDGVILEIDPTIAAVSSLLIVLSLVLLALSHVFVRRAALRGVAIPAVAGSEAV